MITTKKKSTTKKSTRPSSPDDASPSSKPAAAKRSGGAAALADEILAMDNPASAIAAEGESMLSNSRTAATQSARVLGEIIAVKPDLVVSLVGKFSQGISSSNARVVQTSAEALPAIAKSAPARVARQLEILKTAFDETNSVGRDGLVKTFAALCTASVAYQKRLEPILTHALSRADGKTLLLWSETVLPALKGEPHARARSVVEDRLNFIPRHHAQQIADFLGIKLRVRYR